MNAKEIRFFFIEQNILAAAEYLPRKLNIVADKESQIKMDSSEWKLIRKGFHKICQGVITSNIDL